MPHCRRLARVLGLFGIVVCAACGGGAPRGQQADLVSIRQPTPDPTLDAVVRDLPRALAGVAPTATATAAPVVLVQKPAAPKPVAPKPLATQAVAPPKPAVAEPTAKPTARPTQKPALPAVSPTPTVRSR